MTASPLQLLNALYPILVTLFGIVMLLKLLQYESALSAILSPLVITTVFNLSFFTLPQAIAGIVAVSIRQFWNTLSPIPVTLFPIVLFDLRLFVLNWLVFAYRRGFLTVYNHILGTLARAKSGSSSSSARYCFTGTSTAVWNTRMKLYPSCLR